MVTNQKAVDELQYAIDLIKQDGKDWLDERDIPVLEMAISALQAQEWILCKERLPELDEYVLISKKPTKISGSKWSVTIAIRTIDPRSGKIQWRDIGFGVIQDDKVLAWRPLPEPYKEDI